MVILVHSDEWFNMSIELGTDPLWLRGESFSPCLNWIYGGSVVLVAIVSLLGNTSLMLWFSKPDPSHDCYRRYVLSLCMSDFISSLFYWMPAYSSFYGIWNFGKTGCTWYGFAQGYCSLVSICSIAVIAFERSMAVKRPYMMTNSNVAYNKHKWIILGVWTYAFTISSPPLFGWSRYTPVGTLTTCCFDFLTRDYAHTSYYTFLLFGGFILPCTVIIVSYLRIARILLETTNKVNRMRSSSTPEIEELTPITPVRVRRRRNIEIMLTIIACGIGFVIAWLPYASLTIVGQLNIFDGAMLTPHTMTVASLLAKTSNMLNPLIYSSRETKFKQSITTFCCRKPNGVATMV